MKSRSYIASIIGKKIRYVAVCETCEWSHKITTKLVKAEVALAKHNLTHATK